MLVATPLISQVPILDRPEERSQLTCPKGHSSPKYMFQSSIAPKNDRNLMIYWLDCEISQPFQSSIAPKNDRNHAHQKHPLYRGVPILDRPEERSQLLRACSRSLFKKFQSSIAPKNDRNRSAVLSWIQTVWFQSSIAPKNDRNRWPRPQRLEYAPSSFQSSIAPKNDRNFEARERSGFIDRVPILDRPEERSQ